MIIVDAALAKREAEGRPVRVGLVGCGFQGAGIASQILGVTKGIALSAISSRKIEQALAVYRQHGVEPVVCSSRAALEDAIARGRPAVTEDGVELAGAEGLDVIVEVTGSIEFAARVALEAIRTGKHFLQMNAELDGTVGPILKHKADKAGVIYSFTDGDQPGVQMNLYRFVTGLGVKPVLCGNIKGLHDPYRNPATQEAFARKWGQKPAMVASFADGTKISFEQAIVANGTGMQVARRGMLGFDFSGGNPGAPLVPIEEAVKSFDDHLDPASAGIVDYVVGAKPGPGVFVIGHTDDPGRKHFLNLYKLGAGPYYCFYTPYHLCHLEVPASIGRAALFGDSVLAPAGGPRVGVVAVAKTDLEPGTEIVELGGFEVYGVAENMDTIRAQNLLPIGLAVGCRTKGRIAKDTPLTFADVEIPRDRTVDALYREQEKHFGLTR